MSTRPHRSSSALAFSALAFSFWLAILLLTTGAALAQPVPAAPTAAAAPFDAELTIRADRAGAQINRNIYGSFAEHLGRGIYDGIWVGEGSPIPNTRGIRNDVITALRELKLPVLRWPGGCFADEYHWRDGIGPRGKRPRRVNTSWGGIETNAFGLHEFMDLVELVGAEPYVSVNVGSGTPQEMMDWLEYMTSDSDSELAQLRRRNGRQKPWHVKYVGVGNESWGCGGNMRPEYYADEYKRFAAFIKQYSKTKFETIACGPGGHDFRWTEVLMQQVQQRMDGLSLHFYTLPTADWTQKGSATSFGEPEWHATLMQTLRMTELLHKNSAILDKYDPDKRVGLVVDEWGTWYDAEPGAAALYQQSTLRDAVVAGINLNLFNQHAERVRMAASAQAINVLQALVLTKGAQMVLTPTYHVFEMYKVHHDATSLPVELSAPRYALGMPSPGAPRRAPNSTGSVPSLHASASRDAQGVLHVSIVNLDPNRPANVTLKVSGATPKRASGRVLTAPGMTARNDFGAAPSVKPEPLSRAEVQGARIRLSLPSKSVTVIALE